MEKVEATQSYEVPADRVREELSPRTIIEYQGTFDVISVEEIKEEWIVTTRNEEVDPNIDVKFKFAETEFGYTYKQIEEGVFDELITEIIIHREGDTTTVTVQSWFTFGGVFAYVKDWLTTAPRREEIQRLFANLAQNVSNKD
ncbi:hypothetical protein [Natronorubrum sp. FCH18a]|uniref:hypothetical protein n=1 Tax=Natronorubrum sp. FCH18a TaxID=3447018 RepID=UPI003F514A93